MLGTAEGILLFDIKKECFLNDTLPSLHLLKPTVLVRQGEYIYIGAEDGVYTYTLSGGKLERLVSMPAGIRIHAICVRCSAEYGWQPKGMDYLCTMPKPRS